MCLWLFNILDIYFFIFWTEIDWLFILKVGLLIHLSLEYRPDPDAAKWSVICQLSGRIN